MAPLFFEVTMEQKRRGRPPKVVESIKPEINMTRDAILDIRLSMPGYEAKDYTLKVKNVSGKLLSDKKIPDNFIKLIEERLIF